MRQIKLIHIDPNELIPHATPNKGRVKEYIEAMRNGARFPPIKIYRRVFGDKWKITDGTHRCLAAKKLGIPVLATTSSRLYFGEEDMIVRT